MTLLTRVVNIKGIRPAPWLGYYPPQFIRSKSLHRSVQTSMTSVLEVPIFRNCIQSLSSLNKQEFTSQPLESQLKNLQQLDCVAIVNPNGDSFTYHQLFKKITENVRVLRALKNDSDLMESRVAYLIPSNFDHVAMQWAIWGAGGIAVPLCTSHPAQELEYTIQDSGADLIIIHPEFIDKLLPIAQKLTLKSHILEETKAYDKGQAGYTFFEPIKFEPLIPERRCLIIYTSGTTGRPKGVVSTHSNLTCQLNDLSKSWGYSHKDKILHVLPLHHIHGIVPALNCVLYNGGTVEFARKFRSDRVWERFLDSKRDLTLFMAVPTIYSKLASEYNQMSTSQQKESTYCASQFRLMVSGSSSLPGPLFNKWREISGHVLLERYGMTEIGFALTNPLSPIIGRLESHVGKPFPSVKVRLVSDSEKPLKERIIYEADVPGEIQIQGPTLFKEYWNRPDATKQTFEEDGWFKTGDTGICNSEGIYRILGRTSVDIIKCGGYKISALEIEKEILAHPKIAECAVLGLPDEEYGERVGSILVLESHVISESFDCKELQIWLNDKLARYKVPTKYFILDEIPKNQMGKVNKKELRKLVK